MTLLPSTSSHYTYKLTCLWPSFYSSPRPRPLSLLFLKASSSCLLRASLKVDSLLGGEDVDSGTKLTGVDPGSATYKLCDHGKNLAFLCLCFLILQKGIKRDYLIRLLWRGKKKRFTIYVMFLKHDLYKYYVISPVSSAASSIKKKKKKDLNPLCPCHTPLAMTFHTLAFLLCGSLP